MISPTRVIGFYGEATAERGSADDRSWRVHRLARALGGERHDLAREPRRVVLEHEQVDLVEGPLDPRRVDRLAAREQDLLGRGGLRALVQVEELLLELLARAAA